MADKAMDDPHVAVARAVLAWLKGCEPARRKLPISEWTVLAGFVVRSRATGACRVLATATGTKCLGRRDLNVAGLVVNDCHAEVLARRALLRYLYAEALSWQRQDSEDRVKRPAEDSIFAWSEDTHRLMLKPEMSLHLYISESPCGDACIYPLQDAVVDGLVVQRTQRQGGASIEGVERSAMRLTGAKRHQPPASPSLLRKRRRSENDSSGSGVEEDKQFEQSVGVARVKSGRSDLPLDKQTLSMSCSDKLAKWNVLGVQGSLLLQWFDPLRLQSIVVGQDLRATLIEAQREALERAVSSRVEPSAVEFSQQFPSCELHIVAHEYANFDRGRPLSGSASPSPLALNWTLQEPHWTTDITLPTSSTTPSNRQTPVLDTSIPVDQRWPAKFFSSVDVEVLAGVTGLRQGAKKASKLDAVGMDRVASRLAKRNFFRAFCFLLNQAHPSPDSTRLPYEQVKQGVPMSTTLAAAHDSGSALTSTLETYKQRKERFASGFQGWVGVPASFKEFKL